MSELFFCTAATNSYLAQARVLGITLRECHPEARLYLLLVDELRKDLLQPDEPFEVIQLSDLADQESVEQMAFYYRPSEFCFALQGLLNQFMSEKLGCRKWISLDADGAVYGSFEDIFSQLDRHSVLLTPHLIHPDFGSSAEDRAAIRLESYMIHTGVYNGGFLAFRACDETTRFIKWWKPRLRFYAFDERPKQNGDQYWLTAAPSYFPSLGFVRDPGVNVAYWNLFERQVSSSGENLLFDGHPLRYFHFAGFNYDDPERVTNYSIPHGLEGYPKEVRRLCHRYRERLCREGRYESVRNVEYRYSRFNSGELVSPEMRKFYFGQVFSRGVLPSASPFDDYQFFKIRMDRARWRRRLASFGRKVLKQLRSWINPEQQFEVI